MSNFALSGRRAVITGASSGMGAEIAIQMAAAGAAVTLVGRDRGRLDTVAKQIRDAGKVAHTIAQDLTLPKAEEIVVTQAVSQIGGIDILAHVAGIFETGPLEEMPVTVFDRQHATNVRAPFLLTRPPSLI